jgi:hypothetical protein
MYLMYFKNTFNIYSLYFYIIEFIFEFFNKNVSFALQNI